MRFIQKTTATLNWRQGSGVIMTDEIIDACGVPEIFCDGVCGAYVVGGVVRLCFWTWQTSPEGGAQHKQICGKLLITKEGLQSSRAIISRVLGAPHPVVLEHEALRGVH